MTAIATGVFKQLAISRQSALGTIAPGGASNGQNLRRTKSTVDLTKQTFKSAEILSSQQRRTFRHGVQACAGTITGEFSGGTYQNFIESICRQHAQANITTGAKTDIATTTIGITSTTTNFQTTGFKAGMVINMNGWTTPATANNNLYCLVTLVGTLSMNLQPLNGTLLTAKIAGDSVTIQTVGKYTNPPLSGQVKDYYTIEHWFGDVAQSEVFQDCVISQMQLKMPPNGLCTVDFNVMGLGGYTESASQYFSGAAAATSTNVFAAVNAVVKIIGVGAVVTMTGFDLTINGNFSAIGGIVGNVFDPDIPPGVIDVTGNITLLFTDPTWTDYFLNENEIALAVVLCDSATSTTQPPFFAIYMPRVKLGGATKDDSEKQITMTIPFTALEKVGTAGQPASTIQFQDSNWV